MSGKEDVLNQLLTLYLCSAHGKLVGAQELQNSVFLAQLLMQEDGNQGYAFDFIKNQHGPYSPKLHETLKELVSLGFLRFYGNYQITVKGSAQLESFNKILKRNQQPFDRIKKVAKNIGYDEFGKIMVKVFNSQNLVNPKITIFETPMNDPLLHPFKFIKEFRINESELESLFITFDKEYLWKLYQSQQVQNSVKTANAALMKKDIDYLAFSRRRW